MGLFFTLLYIITAYLSPGVLFGPLAPYHVEIFIAAIAFIVSIPAILQSELLRLPQSLAIAGMTFAVFASLATSGWLGGAPWAVYDFLPNVFVFFLVVLHCKSKGHLQLVILTLFAATIFVTLRGWMDLRLNLGETPYLLDQGLGEGKHIYRLRGLSFISDPNDFAQVLVSLFPAVFFFWKKGASFRNALLIPLPIAFLIFSMYLTHSRGAIVALMVVVILAFRRKIGTIASLLVAGAMFAAVTLAGFSGGRDISAEAGADRMDAWAMGLQLTRSHPLFGVGIFRFTDYYQITAHNTIVVCAAELGIVGLFFWVLFVLCSILYGVLLTPKKVKVSLDPVQPTPYSLETSQPLPPADYALAPTEPGEPAYDAANEAEIRRLAGLMVITLCSYLAAGWFLSRAYVMTLYIYGGITYVIFRMAVQQGFAPPMPSLLRLLRNAAIISVTLLLIVYVILRLRA